VSLTVSVLHLDVDIYRHGFSSHFWGSVWFWFTFCTIDSVVWHYLRSVERESWLDENGHAHMDGNKMAEGTNRNAQWRLEERARRTAGRNEIVRRGVVTYFLVNSELYESIIKIVRLAFCRTFVMRWHVEWDGTIYYYDIMRMHHLQNKITDEYNYYYYIIICMSIYWPRLIINFVLHNYFE